MKTKIEIENGETKIILTPENKFEQDAVDNMEQFKIDCYISRDVGYVSGERYIELSARERKMPGVSINYDELMELIRDCKDEIERNAHVYNVNVDQISTNLFPPYEFKYIESLIKLTSVLVNKLK